MGETVMYLTMQLVNQITLVVTAVLTNGNNNFPIFQEFFMKGAGMDLNEAFFVSQVQLIIETCSIIRI